MNCGAHNRHICRADRVDYDPKLLGVLGAIPHLGPTAYEVDRIDNTVGYCFRNMLRCCFKHNCFIQPIELEYKSALSKTGMRVKDLKNNDCNAPKRSECICLLHNCGKCICLTE
jgi:hypothetical protein